MSALAKRLRDTNTEERDQWTVDVEAKDQRPANIKVEVERQNQVWN